MLASVKHLGELSEGLRQGQAGKLTLGCMPGLSPTAMPQIMADYLRDHPDSQLSLQTFSSTKIHDWVAEGQFDLGSSRPRTTCTNWRSRPIGCACTSPCRPRVRWPGAA